MCNRKIIFLFLNQNICCGYSKEPSQWDGFFWVPITYAKNYGLENIYNFTMKIFVNLNLCLKLWLCDANLHQLSSQAIVSLRKTVFFFFTLWWCFTSVSTFFQSCWDTFWGEPVKVSRSRTDYSATFKSQTRDPLILSLAGYQQLHEQIQRGKRAGLENHKWLYVSLKILVWTPFEKQLDAIEIRWWLVFTTPSMAPQHKYVWCGYCHHRHWRQCAAFLYGRCLMN